MQMLRYTNPGELDNPLEKSGVFQTTQRVGTYFLQVRHVVGCPLVAFYNPLSGWFHYSAPNEAKETLCRLKGTGRTKMASNIGIYSTYANCVLDFPIYLYLNVSA